MYRGSICVEVYPRGVQPVKGNHHGVIPISEKFTRKLQRNGNVFESDLNDNEALLSAANSFLFSQDINDSLL